MASTPFVHGRRAPAQDDSPGAGTKVEDPDDPGDHAAPSGAASALHTHRVPFRTTTSGTRRRPTSSATDMTVRTSAGHHPVPGRTAWIPELRARFRSSPPAPERSPRPAAWALCVTEGFPHPRGRSHGFWSAPESCPCRASGAAAGSGDGVLRVSGARDRPQPATRCDTVQIGSGCGSGRRAGAAPGSHAPVVRT